MKMERHFESAVQTYIGMGASQMATNAWTGLVCDTHSSCTPVTGIENFCIFYKYLDIHEGKALYENCRNENEK